MQTEIKNLVSFEFDGSTIKEYKQHIEDLKAAMLGLDSSTEEYIALADECKKEQDKLNEVINDAKYGADKAAGSYNALAAEMAELKRQWRETNNEAERTDLGQRILEINNNLKDMDASIGNFQRNVGNYQQSFEEAFKSGLDITKGLGGNIGGLAEQVKKLIPLIKATSKAATTGVEGFKASLSSTGIGGIIILVSTLLNKLVEFVKKQREAVDTTEAFKKAQEGAKNAVDAHNKELQRQITILRSLGATSVETAKVELDSQQELVNKQEAFIAEREKELELLKKNRMFNEQAKKEMVANSEAEIKALKDVLATTKETLKDRQVAYDAAINQQLLKITEGARKALQTQEEALQEEYDNDVRFLQEHGATQEQLLIRQQQYEKDLQTLRESAAKTATDTDAENAKKRLDELIKRLDDSKKTELQKLEEKYKEEYDLLKDNLEAQNLLTEEYNKKRAEIIGVDSANSASSNMGSADKEAQSALFDAQYAEYAGSEIEIEKQKADAIYNIERDLLKKKLDILSEELENFEGTQEQKLQVQTQINDLMEQQRQLNVKYNAESNERIKKNDLIYANAKKAMMQNLVSSTASILNNLGQMEGENAERNKGLQIAAATINMISGALGAFMQGMANFPAPYGAIVGAAQAAVATTAGLAQIAQIKAIDPKGTVTVQPAPTSIQGVAATPLLNEQQDLMGLTSLNVNGNSATKAETRVWISQEDLENSATQVEVREKNTTF